MAKSSFLTHYKVPSLTTHSSWMPQFGCQFGTSPHFGVSLSASMFPFQWLCYGSSVLCKETKSGEEELVWQVFRCFTIHTPFCLLQNGVIDPISLPMEQRAFGSHCSHLLADHFLLSFP